MPSQGVLPVSDFAIRDLKMKLERDIAYAKKANENENWIVHFDLSIFKKCHDVTMLEVDDILKQIGLEEYIPINHISIW